MTVEVSLTAEVTPLVLACNNDWGGIEHCEKEISGVKAADASGRSVGVRQSGNSWTIGAEPKSRVTVTYSLSPSKPDAMADEETIYYPALNEQYMHVIGHLGLLVPRDPNVLEARPRQIELHWRGFSEAGWASASSWGTARDISVNASYSDFIHSVFIAGDYQLLRADKAQVVLAARPNAWKFGADDLLATALPVVDQARAIFRDTPSPLLLTATPMSVDEDTIHGTMLRGAVAMFFAKPGRLLPSPLLGLMIAHEYFHHWDTLVMRPTEAEGAGILWFTEGFAEFYMRRIAYRAGRISQNDYLWHLNRAILDYSVSPTKSAPNSRVASEFGTTSGMSRLPYNRGQLVALVVDAEIRRRSSGLKSLDDMMRTLAQDAKTRSEPLTTETALKAIRLFTSEEFEARLRRVVVDGEVVSIPIDALLPCLGTDEISVGDGKASRKVLQFKPAMQQRGCGSVL